MEVLKPSTVMPVLNLNPAAPGLVAVLRGMLRILFASLLRPVGSLKNLFSPHFPGHRRLAMLFLKPLRELGA